MRHSSCLSHPCCVLQDVKQATHEVLRVPAKRPHNHTAALPLPRQQPQPKPQQPPQQQQPPPGQPEGPQAPETPEQPGNGILMLLKACDTLDPLPGARQAGRCAVRAPLRPALPAAHHHKTLLLPGRPGWLQPRPSAAVSAGRPAGPSPAAHPCSARASPAPASPPTAGTARPPASRSGSVPRPSVRTGRRPSARGAAGASCTGPAVTAAPQVGPRAGMWPLGLRLRRKGLPRCRLQSALAGPTAARAWTGHRPGAACGVSRSAC